MAITQVVTNSNPFVYLAGGSTKLTGTLIADLTGPAANDVCACDVGCDYTERVFGSVGAEWWKNDKNDFLFQKQIAADTITIKLFKDGASVATITNDTYGTYYSTFTAQALYVGFVVEWEKVLNLLGAGNYQIQADKVLLGVATTFESQKFFLSTYSDEAADGTVRIEAYQTGNILSSQFDYNDLIAGGWYSSFRMYGKLAAPNLVVEEDNIQDENWSHEQVQVKVSNEWELETEQIPSFLSNKLLYDNVLGNQFLVTDYSIYNHATYRRKDLYITNIEKVNEPSKNQERSYKLTLSDKLDNIIKRNY